MTSDSLTEFQVEIISKALAIEYLRGFEDATDDRPYGGKSTHEEQEDYLFRSCEPENFIKQAEQILNSI